MWFDIDVRVFNEAQMYATIVIALAVGFVSGRLYQVARSAWEKWRTAKAELPGHRRTAFEKAGGFARAALVGVLVVAALAAAAYARGEA